jgi:hypothetical protein
MTTLTERSLISLPCADVDSTGSNAIVAAHTKPAATLAPILNMLQPLFIKPASRCFLMPFNMALLGTREVGIARGKRRHN